MQVKKITVAYPVLNGGELFKESLAAVVEQAKGASAEVELLICDSGSTDGSVDAAREAGARVIEIDKSEFQHGRTRNLLVEQADGDVVALLTDDSVPAPGWIDAIVESFAIGDDVALVFGPQIPRPGHSHMIRRDQTEHFKAWGGGEQIDIQKIAPGDEGRAEYEAKKGLLGFFTDSNGAVAKSAWQEVPYREIPYAEDQVLGQEMLEAGFAKVFHPKAAVVHSHDYGPIGWTKRYFDDYRAMLEIMGYRSPVGIRSGARTVIGMTRSDRAFLRTEGASSAALLRGTLVSLRHHSLRMVAEWCAARADTLPAWLTRRLSMEGRGGVSMRESAT